MISKAKRKEKENFILPILGCYENWCFKSTGNIVSIFIILLIGGIIMLILIKKYKFNFGFKKLLKYFNK